MRASWTWARRYAARTREAIPSGRGARAQEARAQPAWPPAGRERNSRRLLQRLQLVEKRPLARDQLRPRIGDGEPLRAIDLREFLLLSRARRPFHGEGVAADRRRVAIALGGPREDRLPAGLAARRERDERSRGLDAGFLEEFAPASGEGILAVVELSLGNGPRAGVLLRPEGPARMRQQHLEAAVAPAVEQDPRALPRQVRRRACSSPRPARAARGLPHRWSGRSPRTRGLPRGTAPARWRIPPRRRPRASARTSAAIQWVPRPRCARAASGAAP